MLEIEPLCTLVVKLQQVRIYSHKLGVCKSHVTTNYVRIFDITKSTGT